MNLAPDWAPNIHPLLVHFPIALLCAAAAVDVVGWAFRRNRPLRQLATLLYVLGTGGAIAAYVTGRAASQTIWLPGMAQAVLRQHWDWALRTVWFFGIVTVVRLVLLRPSRRDPGHAIVAAYFTGRAASQTVWLPGMAQAVLKQHWDWALRTVWFFAGVTVVRLVLLRPSRREPSTAIVAALALAGLVGIGLLVETGDRGGRLVFQHGVGTVRE